MKQFRSVLLISVLAIAVACTGKKVKEDTEVDANGSLNPEITSEPLNPNIQGSDSGQIAGLTTIHFDFDKSTISQGELELLKQNATWIKNHPDMQIQIEGHTDSRGTTEYNLALGDRRAKSVLHTLVKMGIPKTRMTTNSLGEERLLDNGDTEEAHAKNRRANFVPVVEGKPLQRL